MFCTAPAVARSPPFIRPEDCWFSSSAEDFEPRACWAFAQQLQTESREVRGPLFGRDLRAGFRSTAQIFVGRVRAQAVAVPSATSMRIE